LNTPQAQEPPEPVTAESLALAAWYIDPLNRFYRYPLCGVIVRPLVHTPLTPDHVTGLHLGVAALAAWHVSQGDLLTGALIYEVRNILDCLDGVLARAKKSFSLHGAVIDELADGAAFTMLLGGIVYHLLLSGSGFSVVGQAIGVYGLSILMAMNYVLQKNRFQAPLASGVNEVELKLHERYADVKRNDSGFFQRFVWFVERWQNRIAIPTRFGRIMARIEAGSPLDRTETRFLIGRARDPRLFGLILLMSISTGETVITLLQVSLVMGDPMWGLNAVPVFSVIAFVATVVLGNLYLLPAYARK
jgi:hypothetical protein